MTGTTRIRLARPEAGPASGGSREPPPAPAAAATLAVDIGGANTKAAWLDGGSLRTVSRDREALAAVLREVATEVAAGPPSAVAITMTAELSDAFRTKREGVAFV